MQFKMHETMLKIHWTAKKKSRKSITSGIWVISIRSGRRILRSSASEFPGHCTVLNSKPLTKAVIKITCQTSYSCRQHIEIKCFYVQLYLYFKSVLVSYQDLSMNIYSQIRLNKIFFSRWTGCRVRQLT